MNINFLEGCGPSSILECISVLIIYKIAYLSNHNKFYDASQQKLSFFYTIAKAMFTAICVPPLC